MKYRNDIDGLRALSVIIVILDHLGVGWCGGGFVGVDVFFVISGYVITRNIAKESELGTFSMAGFYERRIRRLLPGLAAVTLLVIAAAWFIMLPKDFESLTGSVSAVGFAVSNVFFLLQAGYFDVLSITSRCFTPGRWRWRNSFISSIRCCSPGCIKPDGSCSSLSSVCWWRFL
jgi:peptidoglycan/LPS O-acetylase OafA/YrhL